MVAVTQQLSDISTAESATGWAGASGGLDAQVFKQGNNAWTYQTPKNGIGLGSFTPAANINMTANYTTPHLYWVMRCDVMTFCELLNTGATNSGLMLRVTDGSGNYVQWHVEGRDTWDGGWKNFVFDLTNTTKIHSTSGTLSLADVDIISWYTDNTNSGTIRIIDNTWLDAVRYGDGLQVQSTTTEDFDFGDVAVEDALVANYYQVLQRNFGILAAQGGFEIGDGAGSGTTSLVSKNEQIVFQDQVVGGAHYKLVGVASATATTDIDIKGAIFSSDELTGPDVDWSDTDINSIIFRGTMLNMGSFVYQSGADCSPVAYVNCGQITPDGADMRDSAIAEYEGTANTSALIYNNAADPDGELDGMEFIRGAAATHAIEFGVDVPASLTLRNCIFSGYNAADTQDDSTFHFKDTGGTITLNLIGCTGNFTYRSDGATIVLEIAPVTVLIKVLDDTTGLAIPAARVWVGKDSDKSELHNSGVDANGETSFQYTYVSDLDIVGWAREQDLTGIDYIQKDFSGTITDAGFSLTIRLVPVVD